MKNMNELSMILDLEKCLGTLYPLVKEYAEMKLELVKMEDGVRRKQIEVNYALDQTASLFGRRLDVQQLLGYYDELETEDVVTSEEVKQPTREQRRSVSSKVAQIEESIGYHELMLRMVDKLTNKLDIDVVDGLLGEIIEDFNYEQEQKDEEDYINACFMDDYEEDESEVKETDLDLTLTKITNEDSLTSEDVLKCDFTI